MPTIKKRSSAPKIQSEQQITTIAHHVSAFLSMYKRQFTIAASVVAAVLVIVAGYALVRSQQEQKAAPLVASAYEFYNPSAGAADYQKALAAFREVRQKYSSTMSGAIAQYYIGNCLMNLGQTDEALKEYQVFITKFSAEKLLRGLVYQRMGYLYSGLGKQADAIKAFEQSEMLLGPGVATVELAKAYEASGNSAESQKKYKTVMEKLGGTSWGMDAMGKVQKIEQPVKPPVGKEGK